MKQFIINSTSTLLSAATVLGIVVFAAAPARADTNDAAKIIFGLILGAAIADSAQAQPQHQPHGVNQARRELDRAEREYQRQLATTPCYSRDELKPDGYIVRYVYNCENRVIHAYHP